jgi:hypothetical protein
MIQIKRLLNRLLPPSYRTPNEHRRLRETIDENPDSGLIVWPRPNSDLLYYVFHGMAGKLMMQPLTALRESGLLGANLVLLKDRYRFFYHAGLNTEITDIAGIRLRLERCREELPHVRRTFSFGTSGGGYAAILFGHYLNVDVAYAFGPPTLLNLPRLKDMGAGHDVGRFSQQHLDLALLLSHYNGRSRYKIFYCGDNARDKTWAEHLRDSPGVELYPQPGNTHQVLRAMHELNRLRGILDADKAQPHR